MTLGDSVFPLAKIYCLTRLSMSQMIIKPGEIALLSSLRELRHLELDPRLQSNSWFLDVTIPSEETQFSKEDFQTIASFNNLNTLWLGYSSLSHKRKKERKAENEGSSNINCSLSLSFYSLEFDPANVELLRSLTNLTRIDIPAVCASVESIKHFSGLTTLQVL
jgi:hypothetical protein